MQLVDNVLRCDRTVKLTTTEGTYSGPLEIRSQDDGVQCRRDIDEEWTRVPSTVKDIHEIALRVESWIDHGPPRDRDGRIIPLSLV